jgi:hypothetical protein
MQSPWSNLGPWVPFFLGPKKKHEYDVWFASEWQLGSARFWDNAHAMTSWSLMNQWMILAGTRKRWGGHKVTRTCPTFLGKLVFQATSMDESGRYGKCKFSLSWYRTLSSNNDLKIGLGRSLEWQMIATVSTKTATCLKKTKNTTWLVVLTILKSISQWEGLSHILL